MKKEFLIAGGILAAFIATAFLFYQGGVADTKIDIQRKVTLEENARIITANAKYETRQCYTKDLLMIKCSAIEDIGSKMFHKEILDIINRK